jgi:acyl carrier protein
MQDQIRQILAQNGRLAVPIDRLADEADLFAAGLDSLAIVNVLMSLEEHFDIELPDELLSRRTFASIASITRVVTDLTERVPST